MVKQYKTDAERVKDYLEKNPELVTRPIDSIFYRLAEKITGVAKQEVLPHLLERAMDLEQARIADILPGTANQVAEKLGLNPDVVINQLNVMFGRGLVFKGRQGWSFVRGFPTLHDSLGTARSKFTTDDPFKLALIYMVTERPKAVIRPGTPVSGMRVIPRWKAIKDLPGVLPVEIVPQILRARKPIAVHECPCCNYRPDWDYADKVPLEKCMSIGESLAGYAIERGPARELTYVEALEYVDRLAELDVVHVVANFDSMSPFLCNCHPLSCGMLLSGFIVKSRFQSVVDPVKCQESQNCVERCPVGAIMMKSYTGYLAEKAYIDGEKCIGCGICVIGCKYNAISMKIVRPLDYIPEMGSRPGVFLNYPEAWQKDFSEKKTSAD